VRHLATARFWRCYHALPQTVRELADRNFAQLKADPAHRSLHFKKIGEFRSARVGLCYRALARDVDQNLAWFWIGTHAEYDKLLSQRPANKRLQPTAARKPAKKSRPGRRG
jgi:DNA-binding transcriptional regulator GbsR (MarR family)